MKRRFFSHPGLMVVSLVLAFVLWISIINIENPETTKTYTLIPVTLTNTSYVESKAQLYAMATGLNAVNVTVTTTRKTLERISSSAITATADLTQVEDFTAPVYVPVSVSVPGVSPDHVVVNPKMLEVKLEETESSEFSVNAVSGGTRPGKKYEIGKMTAKPATVKIRGPKSLVSIIGKVNATVDVTGFTKDQTVKGELVIYDKNGAVFDEKKMNNLTIGDGSSSVMVSVELYQIVNGATIVAEPYGIPAAGYRIGDVTTTPSTLSVVGDEEAIEAFKALDNTITIPSSPDAVDVSGANNDQEITLDITPYLPEGIKLTQDTSSTVVITAKILPVNGISLELETKNIVKENLGADLSAVFDDSKIDIRVQSDDPAAGFRNIEASDLKASVDLRGVREGTVPVPVDVVLPEGWSLVEEVIAGMTVSAVEKAEP